MTLLVVLFVPICAGAQQKWKHEIVLRNVVHVDTNVYGRPVVNRRGDYVIAAAVVGGYQDIYVNGFNLTKSVLGDVPRSAFTLSINAKGQVEWQGHRTGERHDIYVDSFNWSGSLPDSERNGSISLSRLDDFGIPTWMTNPSGGVGKIRLYRGHELMNGAVPDIPISGLRTTGSGHVAWAVGGASQGYAYRVFRDTYGVSDAVLGPVFEAKGAIAINDAGHVAWTRFDQGSINEDVYIDAQNYSHAILGDEIHQAGVMAMNSKGDLLWAAAYGDGRGFHIYKNDISITRPLFDSVQWLPGHLSESGHVSWGAVFFGNIRKVYKDQTELSAGLLGENNSVSLTGIDDIGRVLWQGKGTALQDRPHVFVDNFDLSLDLMGQMGGWGATPIQIGGSGHVLWQYAEDSTGLRTIVLSTPVSEPSLLVGVLSGLGFLTRRLSRLRNP